MNSPPILGYLFSAWIGSLFFWGYGILTHGHSASLKRRRSSWPRRPLQSQTARSSRVPHLSHRPTARPADSKKTNPHSLSSVSDLNNFLDLDPFLAVNNKFLYFFGAIHWGSELLEMAKWDPFSKISWFWRATKPGASFHK